MNRENVSPAMQAELRASGLLATASERWTHPSGLFALEPLPAFADRRQSDRRLTKRDRTRLEQARSTN